MRSPSDRLRFALTLAERAAREILARFPIDSVEFKADGTEVTEADRAAESVMREVILAEYPEHGILGEEAGETAGRGTHTWVLDPIDGTAWFGLGIPKFGTLIALLEDRTPVLGVIHLPVSGETLYAERGEGTWYRRGSAEARRVSVDPKVTGLDAAFVSSAGVHNSEIVPGARTPPFRLTQVIRRAARFRFVGDCVQHMLVAKGMLHAALDPVMMPWDSAAIVPCVREAGGEVSTMDGDTRDIVFGGSLLTASSPELHRQILELVNG